MKYFLLLTSLILISFVTNAVSDDSNSHHKNDISQDAHVHGIAEMTIAAQDNDLEIFIASPSINLVGFEYRASNEKERNAVKQANTLLNSPDILFSFTGAKCIAVNTDVDLSPIEDTHHDHSHNQHPISHSEVEVAYRFSCDHLAKLEKIKMSILSKFPGIKKMKTTWIINNNQGVSVLTTKSKTLNVN